MWCKGCIFEDYGAGSGRDGLFDEAVAVGGGTSHGKEERAWPNLARVAGQGRNLKRVVAVKFDARKWLKQVCKFHMLSELISE